VTGCRVPFLPPPPPKRQPVRKRLSWSSASLRHVPTRWIRSLPRPPRLGTFRPQGLGTLSTICSPTRLAMVRRPRQRPWDSPFRVLLLPTSGAPLGASPLLSFPRRRFRGRGRDSRGWLWPGRGTKALTRRSRPPNLALLGFRPFRVFSSIALGPASRSEPSMPFRPEVLPTFPLPGGASRDCEQWKRLVSLETACPPGVVHLPALRAS
jgi:hypothetical protein